MKLKILWLILQAMVIFADQNENRPILDCSNLSKTDDLKLLSKKEYIAQTLASWSSLSSEEKLRFHRSRNREGSFEATCLEKQLRYVPSFEKQDVSITNQNGALTSLSSLTAGENVRPYRIKKNFFQKTNQIVTGKKKLIEIGGQTILYRYHPYS